MGEWADLESWLASLRRARQVFHSEADFQHALAWAIHMSDPQARVRLETRPAHGMRLDLLISRPDLGKHLALELKYLTAAWTGEADGEQFELLSQGAQDIRAYDVVKDMQRVEQFVEGKPGWSGAVLVLANDPGYWSRPGHGRATNADAFRIYEDQVVSGRRAWGPGTGAGTRKGREAAIELGGDYTCRWSAYSALPGRHGTFRLLVIAIGGSQPATEGRRDDSGKALPGLHPEVARLRPGRATSPEPKPVRVGDLATTAGPEQRGATLNKQRYSVDELRAEVRRFEYELRVAGLKQTSITTYVDRTGRFLKWLDGDYQPRGPN
jgi:hypothetical protein